MKRNDTEDFCILSLEPADDKAALIQNMTGQHKPVVILLAEQTRLFQRPEDFADLKHVKRQLNLSIVFVIPQSERLTLLAGRHGFPVYLSLDALADALMVGQLTRQRTLNAALARTTTPLTRLSGPLPTTPRPYELDQATDGYGQSLLTKRNFGASPAVATHVSAKRTVPLMTERRVSGRLSASPVNVQTEEATAPLFQPFAQTPLQTTPVPPAPPAVVHRTQHRHPLTILLVILLVIALGGAGITTFITLFHGPTSTALAVPPIVGHVTFLSSEQVNENTDQGIDDQVLIDLHTLPHPAAQQSYYAWLLSDLTQGDSRTVLLGTLPVLDGNAHLLYAGDQQHTNLLAFASRFLVTEEDASVAPIAPSLDYSTWRYYAAFSQTPSASVSAMDGMTHYSFLDHLRHLLASDPMLNQLELPGGLNTWLTRNIAKIVEWTSSMPDTWQESRDIAFIRRQTVRVLTYLDGISFVQQDIPANTPLGLNERLARVGLLPMPNAAQGPMSYLDSIVFHLNGLIQDAKTSASLRASASTLIAALSNVQAWLTQVRLDALQLLKMSDQQLNEPATLTLLNNLLNNATHAYTGMVDPTTSQMRNGVLWIHHQMQMLATLDVTAYSTHHSPIQLVSPQQQMNS